MKLLLAEDTKDMNRVITVMLEHEGYEVDPVFDGGQALEHLQADVYDGAILDIMMPVMSGLDVLRQIREAGAEPPVLMLTAKSEIDDRVTGLDAGANDYLSKPFAMKELLARVRAMVRTSGNVRQEALEFKDIRLDPGDLSLTAENSVSLAPREFALMRLLIKNQGRPLATKYLLDHVWANEPGADAEDVWLYISYIRAKLTSVASCVVLDGERGGFFRLR